jgi:hypothetical protein
MEIGRDGHLPVLNIDICRRPDGSLGHNVYRKLTHTNLYLTLDHITLPPTYSAFFQRWCIQPGLFAKKKDSTMSWSSSKPVSGKMLMV